MKTRGGHSTFISVWMSGLWAGQNGGLKIFFFSKGRSKELKFCNILGYELTFGPNVGCRAENS